MAEGRRRFVEEGSGQEINRSLEAHPEREEDLMLTLSYFDPMNFAADIHWPTVYAIANHLGGPHQVARLPVSHTERPEQKLWERFEAYWLRLVVEGVPPDFGERKEFSI